MTGIELIAKERQEIQEQAEKVYPKYPNGGNINLDQHVNCKRKAFVKGAQWVQEREKWISVEERLPELHKRVTICEWTGGLTEPSILQGSWEGNRWRLYGGSTAEIVSHWQPLVNPPKV